MGSDDMKLELWREGLQLQSSSNKDLPHGPFASLCSGLYFRGHGVKVWKQNEAKKCSLAAFFLLRGFGDLLLFWRMFCDFVP